MNKIERMNTVLAGGKPDYVPHCLWYHHAHQYGEEAMRDHLQFLDESDNDFLKIINDFNFSLPSPVTRPEDWAQIRVANKTEPYFVHLLDLVKRIVDAGHGKALIYLTIFSPFGESGYAVGQRATSDVKTRSPAVLDGLKKIEESLLLYVEEYFKAGIDGVFYSCTGGKRGQFSEEEFETLIKPGDLAVLEKANTYSSNNMLHICSTDVRMEPYRDYPCRVVNWNVHEDGLSLLEGREFFRGKILFGGMVGGWHARGPLSHGTSADAAEEATRVLQEFGGQGLILGPDCSLPNGSPLANIQAAAKVCREWKL